MYLTTKDLQQLVKVDKSTIYRMAEDGRLPAIKVGRQWRFRDEDIRRWLEEPARAGYDDPPASRDRFSTAARHLVDLFSDLFGVMVVVTDIDGKPLTDVVNPCGFFSALRDVPHITDLCTAEWAALGTHPALIPTWLESRFGFKCARAFLRSDNQLVGMVIAGGVRSARTPDPASLDELAGELGIGVDRLEQHHADMYDLDEVHQAEVARGLAILATHLSDLRINSEQRSEQ